MSSPNASNTGTIQLCDTHAWRSSSSNTLAYSGHLRPSAQHHASAADSPNSQEHDADFSEGRFPYKAYDMLEDKAMATYVHWHQEGGSHGLFIPNVDAFVEHALSKHFPGVTKWGSFQKQLSNYGFHKQGRSSTWAFYTHWNGKFRQGHPELLPDVTRKPRQDAVQKQPATIPDICMAGSQPLSLQELHARISRLENDITDIRSENLQVKNENNQLKYEIIQLRNELWRLIYRQSLSEERLDGMEPRVQEIMRRLAATSLGSGGLNSVGEFGSGVVAFNNNFYTNEAGNLSGVLGGFPFKPQVGADGSGASQNVPPLPGTGASDTTINPALFGQPSYPLLSGLDSGANPGISLPYSGGHTSPGHGRQLAQQYWMQNASQNNPGTMYPVDSSSGHQQVSIPETGAASFAHNAPTVMLTNQALPRFPISNSPGASGRRAPLGAMFLVPHLTSPIAQAARREP